MDASLAATDPAATVNGAHSDLRIDLIAVTSLPGSVLKHRLKLLAGSGCEVNDRPDLVRKSCALSQSENFDQGPTKMWNAQSFACTVIGLACWNFSSAGFT